MTTLSALNSVWRVIFVSHSAKQARTAEAIVAGIESRGGKCWIAPRDIAQGVTYAGQIVEAIKQCNIMLVLVSADSIKSVQVVREVERGVHYDRKLVVVLLEDVDLCGDLEYFLSAVQWFPATKGVDDEVVDRICSLLPDTKEPAALQAVPSLPATSKMELGQMIVELGSSGKFDSVWDAHNASDKTLARIHFKRAAVLSWRLQPATVWFMMQASSFTALQREFLSRTLESTTGVRWTACRIVETAPNERPYQIPLYLLSSYDDRAEDTEGESLVCFLSRITEYEDECAEALAILSKTTRSVGETEVYVTQKGQFTYVHGNFQQEGESHPTKLITTLKVSLATMVSNLIFPPEPSEGSDKYVHHLQKTIRIYVNQDKFTITDPTFYSGARNVEFVGDHPKLLRLRSDRAKTREELQAVFERQRDTLGIAHDDTVLTVRRIEGKLLDRLPGASRLPDDVSARVTSAMEFAKEAGIGPSVYTLEVAYRASMPDKARERLEVALRPNAAFGLQLVEEVEKYDRELARTVVASDVQEILADRKDAGSFRTKAQLWGRFGEIAKAYADYRQLIALNEATDEDFTHAAWSAPREAGPEEFTAICSRGLEKHPESSLLNANYGRLLRISDRHKAALARLNRAAEIVVARGGQLGSGALFDLVCCEWIVGGADAAASHLAALATSDLSLTKGAYEWTRDRLDPDNRAQVRTAIVKAVSEDKSVDSLRFQATLHKESGDFAGQLKVLKRIINESQSTGASDFVEAANAARAVDDKVYMLEALTQGETRCPGDAVVPFRRGWIMLAEGDFEDARQSFLRMVAVIEQNNDTASASTLSGLARSQWCCQDEEGAATTMRLICGKSPSTATEVVTELKNADRAALAAKASRIIADFDFPADSAEGLHAKAQALSKLERLAECVATRKQLAALPDATALNHAELIYETLRLGDEASALAAYQTARAKFPVDNVIPMNAGWAWISAGKGEEALVEFELGLSLCPPNSVYTYLPLGVAAAQWLLGEKEKALAAFMEVLKTDSSYKEEKTIRDLDWPEPEFRVVEAVRKAYLTSRSDT